MDGWQDSVVYVCNVILVKLDVIVLVMGMLKQEWVVIELWVVLIDYLVMIICGGVILDFFVDWFLCVFEWMCKVKFEWLF